MAERKQYGTSPGAEAQLDILSHAGDPEFEVDSQNNDHYFRTAADRARELGEDAGPGGME